MSRTDVGALAGSTALDTHSRRAEFWQGINATFPLVVGAAPFDLYRWDGESDAFMAAGEGLVHLGRFRAPESRGSDIRSSGGFPAV